MKSVYLQPVCSLSSRERYPEGEEMQWRREIEIICFNYIYFYTAPTHINLLLLNTVHTSLYTGNILYELAIDCLRETCLKYGCLTLTNRDATCCHSLSLYFGMIDLSLTRDNRIPTKTMRVCLLWIHRLLDLFGLLDREVTAG